VGKIKVFVDLDDTLIDTAEIKRGMFGAVANLGVMAEEVESRYRKLRDTQPFTIDGFVAVLSDLKDQGAVREALEDYFANLSPAMIEGRMEWLDAQYPPDRFERILYTYGNPEFQETKVKGLGLEGKFDRILYIEGDKAEALSEYVGEDEIFIFIDDKENVLEQVGEHFPHAEIYHVKEHNEDPEIYVPVPAEPGSEPDLRRS